MASKRKHKALESFHFCTRHSINDEHIRTIRLSLRKWYQSNARDLPWRHTETYSQNDIAYRVLVSEIMLQQTQVKTVIDYYNRWMERWPTLSSLAEEADVQQILTAWSGLGYYNRAKRLYETAQIITNEFDGIFPSDFDTLVRRLPGIGAYTAGAICSIAFGQPSPAVDGNILRIVSRLCGISLSMLKSKQELTRVITKICESLVDTDQPGHFNQCLMDIGATICTPKANPKCSACPLSDVCVTYNNLNRLVDDNNTSSVADENGCCCYVCENRTKTWAVLRYGFGDFPGSTKSKPSPITHYVVIALEFDGGGGRRWLMSQRPSTGLLSSLWEFVVVEADRLAGGKNVDDIVDKDVENYLSCKLGEIVERETPPIDITHKTTLKHIFSHRVHMYRLFHVKVEELECEERLTMFLNSNLEFLGNASQQFRTVDESDLPSLAISTSVKKMLKFLD